MPGWPPRCVSAATQSLTAVGKSSWPTFSSDAPSPASLWSLSQFGAKRQKTSGAPTKYPASASRSATERMYGPTPNISWITRIADVGGVSGFQMCTSIAPSEPHATLSVRSVVMRAMVSHGQVVQDDGRRRSLVGRCA